MKGREWQSTGLEVGRRQGSSGLGALVAEHDGTTRTGGKVDEAAGRRRSGPFPWGGRRGTGAEALGPRSSPGRASCGLGRASQGGGG